MYLIILAKPFRSKIEGVVVYQRETLEGDRPKSIKDNIIQNEEKNLKIRENDSEEGSMNCTQCFLEYFSFKPPLSNQPLSDFQLCTLDLLLPALIP